MSELGDQLKKHYDAQALPAAKAEAVLAEGRAAVDGERKAVAWPRSKVVVWRVAWVAAAATVLVAALVIWRNPLGPSRVSYAVFAPSIVNFFGGRGPTLPKRSQNPEELRAWLIAHGAPGDYQIPAKLGGLKSFGCEVLDVHGRPAYLTCFWAEKKPGADEGELVHLLVAHRADFVDAPPTGGPQLHEEGGWSFAAWSDGDVIYTMAARAPMDKLRKFVAAAISSPYPAFRARRRA